MACLQDALQIYATQVFLQSDLTNVTFLKYLKQMWNHMHWPHALLLACGMDVL